MGRRDAAEFIAGCIGAVKAPSSLNGAAGQFGRGDRNRLLILRFTAIGRNADGRVAKMPIDERGRILVAVNPAPI